MTVDENQSDMRNEKGLRRRSFLMRAILSLFWGTMLSRVKATANASASGVNEEELAPFRKIAREKGVRLVVQKGKKARTGPLSKMHLDMDMVRASLQNAIARAKRQGLSSIQQKLERLLANGTAAQQVDFVLGSGYQYFFPEDVERMAAMAEQDKFHTFAGVCGTFCWLACTCTGEYEQKCRERCREIFCPEESKE